MKQQIEELEKTIQALKDAYEKEEKENYLNQPHKSFKEGDYVTNGVDEGIVGWVENKACNVPESNGVMGVSILNGNMCFAAFVRRNDFEYMSDERAYYYKNEHVITFKADGSSINRFLRSMAYNFNAHDGQTNLLDALNYINTNHNG